MQKHRLYTGDIANHLYVKDWDVDGNVLVVNVSFAADGGEVYEYEIEIPGDLAREMDEDLAKETLVAELLQQYSDTHTH